MTLLNKNTLNIKNFPLSNKYDANWILKNSMGINTLWLTEWFCSGIEIKPGMRILDLGCGKVLSSIMLAKEFNVNVWAYDLWNKPTENWERIKEENLENNVFPIYGDARQLPFADGFFDLIICIDAFIYFGSDDLYLNYIQKFLAPGGIIGFVNPGLMKPFNGPLPEHLNKFWGQDCWSWHTLEWWKNHWEKTGLVNLLKADTLTDGCNLFLKYDLALKASGDNRWPDDIEVLKNDNGEYIGFIRIIAQKL